MADTKPRAPAPRCEDGSILPRLIYGTCLPAPEETQPNVDLALQSGYRAIDTASSRSLHDEVKDGEAIRRRLLDTSGASLGRSSFWVQTKYTPVISQPEDKSLWPYTPSDSQSLRVFKSFARSMQDLGCDRVDVYFLHTMVDTLAEMIEAWKAMEQLVSHRAVRHLGMCNAPAYVLEDLWAHSTIKPAFVQNPISRGDAGYAIETIAFCTERGVSFQAFGLFWKSNAHLLESAPVRMVMENGLTAHQALIQLMLEAAEAIALDLYILDGTTSGSHMAANMSVLDKAQNIDETNRNAFLDLLGWTQFATHGENT